MSLPFSRGASKVSTATSSESQQALLNLAVFLAGFATFVNMWCTQAILPVLASSFHVAQARTGLSVTAPLMATALMAPLVGAISDRFGRKKLICGAAFLLTLPTILASQAGSFDTFIADRFVQGLLLPFIFTVTIAYIGGEAENNAAAAKMAGIYTSGAIFGGFSGRLISGIATGAFGWRLAFIIITILTFAIAFVIANAMPREKKFTPQYGLARALKSFPMHLTNQKLLSTFAVGLGVLFSLVAVFTFINFRLAEAPYFLGPAALGGIFVVYLGGVAMSPIAARLANRFGRKAVMSAAGPIIGVGLLMTLAAPLPIIGIGLLLICSAIFVQQTLATAFVSVATREAKSTAVGLYVTFYYIGGSLGGIIPAGLWRDYGWPGCVAIVAIMQVVMLTIVLSMWTTDKSGERSA